MDRSTTEVRMAQWTKLLQQWAESGMTKKDWCQQNGISQKSLYYWQRKIRLNALAVSNVPAKPSAPAFAEVSIPVVNTDTSWQTGQTSFIPDIRIIGSSLTIEISNTVSDKLLSVIGKVIDHVE